MPEPICLNPKAAFHVHTWRCGHASDEREEAYIKTAIRLGAEQITFTDHAPFPGNQFQGRMKMEQLPEYEETLWDLKEKYQGKIKIRIGLEIEYLPGFQAYYEQLKHDNKIEFLMLGQHFYEVEPGIYSFEKKEWKQQADKFIQSEIDGIKSGYFSCVAHPDRGYRYLPYGTYPDEGLAKELIAVAKDLHTPLEKNIGSMAAKCFYQSVFWCYHEQDYLLGLDAHSTYDLRRRYQYSEFLNGNIVKFAGF